MRAKVLRSFRDKNNGRYYKRRDIISVTQQRFEDLEGKYLEKAETGAALSPKRDSEGNCIICNNKKNN